MTETGQGEPDGVPPHLRRAWGLTERPGKGPKPGLSTERVVAAAITVAAEEGLPALSMGRVARELGASTMSLYRYVASKDELLLLMEDAASGTPPAAPDPSGGWRPALTAWSRDLLELYTGNAWMLRMAITTPPITPNSVAWMERGLAALRETRLDAGEKLGVIMLVSGYVRQYARLATDLSDAIARAGSTPDATMAGYGAMLGRLADRGRFPEVAAVVATGEIDKADEPDADFAFGLDTTLDGVAALVDRRAG